MKPIHRRQFGAFALTLALAACGKSAPDQRTASNPSPASAPAAQPFVAIARGRVDVEGGIVRVVAPRDGIVAQVHGNVGDAVKAGDVLVAFDTTQAQLAVGMANAELKQAQAQAQALRGKRDALTQRLARVDEAARAGAASGQSADDAKQALQDLDAEIAVADANVEADRQKLKQAQYEVDVRSLRAPVAGRVVARGARVGDAVSTQSPTVLVELLPDGPRIVRAELNEGFVAKVKPGMSAQVYSEADGAKTYTAHVRRVGDVFGPSKLAEEGQEPIDARDVECILDLGDSDLRVGQRVQVRFLPAQNSSQGESK